MGPDLSGIATRSYLAGEKENSPEKLLRRIQHPRQQVPGTAMPELNVSESDAKDIAAHLYTLKQQ